MKNIRFSSQGKKKILVMDHDEVTTQMIATALSKNEAYDVEICNEPSQAHERASVQDYHLLIVDVQIPFLNIDMLSLCLGVDPGECVESPPSKLLLMGEPLDQQNLKQLFPLIHASSFLEKPFDEERLIAKVTSILSAPVENLVKDEPQEKILGETENILRFDPDLPAEEHETRDSDCGAHSIHDALAEPAEAALVLRSTAGKPWPLAKAGEELLYQQHTALENTYKRHLRLISIKIGFSLGLGMFLMGLITLGPIFFTHRVLHFENSIIIWLTFIWSMVIIFMTLHSKWLVSVLDSWKNEIRKLSHQLNAHHRESSVIHHHLWERKAAG